MELKVLTWNLVKTFNCRIMKNIIKTFFLVALCAMTFVSCQKEPLADKNNNESEYLYNFSIVNADAPTKTTLNGTTVTWEDKDKLGFFATGTENKYGTISTLSPKVIVPVYLASPLTAGSKVYAYFPYSDKATSAAAIPFNIPASQNGDFDNNPQISIPYLVSKDFAAKQTDVDDMKFCNLGSVILFKVYSTVEAYRSETINSITFESASNIAGNFTLDATAVDYSTPSTLAPSSISNGSKKISLSCAPAIGSSVETAGEACMVVIPGSYAGTVKVSTNVANYSYTFTTPKNFVRSSIKPLNIDLGKTGARTAAPTKTFEKITTAPAEIDGEFIFVNSPATHALTGALLTNEKLGIAPVQPASDGSITCLAEYALTIQSIGSGLLTIQNSDGSYIALKESGSNSAALSSNANTNKEKYTLSLSATGIATLASEENSNRSIRFNGTTDARFYSGTSGSVSGFLYKLVDSREQLATPSVTVVGDEMEWEAVENAGSYTIVIGTQSKSGITGTSYTYSSTDFTFDPGYYEVSVYAVPADPTSYKESALGEGDARIKVGTPTLATPELESSSITASGFVISWTADANATNGYSYAISPEPAKTPVITNNSATFTGLAAETEYKVYIQAEEVTGDEPWAASEIGEITVTTSKAGTITYTYKKVTSSTDLSDGTYLIVCENNNVAFNGGLETLDAVSNYINVTINNGEIATGTDVDAATFTYSASSGSFKSKSGKYIGNSSDSNALKTDTTELTNTVIISNGDASIMATGGSYLRYNASSGQTRFRYFKSGTYKAQQAIQLYKLQVSN